MNFSLSDLAAETGGVLRGDGRFVVTGAASLKEAGPGDISFLGNPKYAAQLKTTRAGALILPFDASDTLQPAVLHSNPQWVWAKVLEKLQEERLRHPQGVDPRAAVSSQAHLEDGVSVGAFSVVEEGARLGQGTVIYPHVYVGRDVVIGSRCVVYPHVTLRERVKVGNRCILQPSVVIGGDGFGFVPTAKGLEKIPQVGTVEIADDVEIQANSTIDRAAVGTTVIGSGTKIDNLVQVAHNVEIGSHCLVVALTGIAGSARLGTGVVLAAQVGVAGHLSIGDNVQVGGKAGVTQDLPANEKYWGTPAHPLRDELKLQALIRKLPRLFADVNELKSKG